MSSNSNTNTFNILDYIPFGKENAVKKQELINILGFPERAIRQMIEDASRENPVINLMDGRGYFQPTEMDLDEAERCYNQEMHRAKSILYRNNGLKQFLRSYGRLVVVAETENSLSKVKVREHYRKTKAAKTIDVEGQISFL